MILLILFLATMFAIGLSLQRGIVAAPSVGAQALIGGVGAGLGVIWRYALGQGDAHFLIQMAFTGASILMLFGAYHYGQRIRRLRAEVEPETFE